jgi:hypothetical protein
MHSPGFHPSDERQSHDDDTSTGFAEGMAPERVTIGERGSYILLDSAGRQENDWHLRQQLRRRRAAA